MILIVLQILFPVAPRATPRRTLSMWLHTDAMRLARRIEPLLSHAMVGAAGALFLMMIGRVIAAWAAGRL